MTKHEVLTIIPSATVNAIFNTSGSGQAVKGWVEKIVFTNTNWAAGSIAITDKTTGENIHFAGNVSGALPVVRYPRHYVETQGAITLSGTAFYVAERMYINGPVNVSGIGLGSSTAGTTGRIDIYYYD